MSLTAFGVKNLRCLTETPLIPLRPITVLVGRNGSGKSTFLRAFPLLRQSLTTERKSPILWEHPDYVDFGSLETAVRRRASPPEITFSFEADHLDALDGGKAVVDMTLAQSLQRPYLRSYELRARGQIARLAFDLKGQATLFKVDDTDYLPQVPGLALAGSAYLLPWVDATSGRRVAYRPHVHPAFRLTSEPRMVELLPPDTLASATPNILMDLDAEISDFLARVAYIGPERAVGQREYKRSERAVNEVHSRGVNLADFLGSLTEEEMESFARFCSTYLGSTPSIVKKGSHIELLLDERGTGAAVNVADTGFGYAEILPVAAAVWASCVRPLGPEKPRRTSMIAIEQPELHLHPALQAKLARMFAGALRENERMVAELLRKAGHAEEGEPEPSGLTKILVEAHSAELIQGLGDEVRAGRLSPEDVQLVVFEQAPKTGETVVRLAGYELDGTLNDAWPIGFFTDVDG